MCLSCPDVQVTYATRSEGDGFCRVVTRATSVGQRERGPLRGHLDSAHSRLSQAPLPCQQPPNRARPPALNPRDRRLEPTGSEVVDVALEITSDAHRSWSDAAKNVEPALV